LKNFESRKLFYGKYLYALKCRNSIGTIFRNKDLRRAKTVIDNLQRDDNEGIPLWIKNKKLKREISKEDFNDIKTLHSFFANSSEDFVIRCQNISLNIYSNNKDWLKNIQHNIKCAIEFWQPNQQYVQFLIENSNIILVDNPDYQYKISFGHKTVPNGFAKWCEANKNKVKITDDTLDNIKKDGYCHGRYMYIKDDSILMLCNLIAGDCFNRIDKLVYRQNIDK